MKLLPWILVLMFTVSHFSQRPPIEAGVPKALAEWRASRYSDVRYKLNLMLEKMSPVLKGTIEIRVNMSVPPAVAGGEVPPIVLDWRKIRGNENLSTVSNVSLNGTELKAPPATAGGTDTAGPIFEESNEHLIFRDGVKAGENVIKLDFTSPILASGSAITRYVDKEDGSEYLYSLFVPSDASTAFPVFDQPDLKARFSLTVAAPMDWKVVSNSASPIDNPATGQGYKKWINMDVVGPVNSKGGWVTTTPFPETKPISTYVFAFAAGPWVEFDEASSVGGNLSGSEGVQVGQGSPQRTTDQRGTLATGRVSASASGKSNRDESVRSPHVSKGSAVSTDNVEPSLTVGLRTRIHVRKSQAEKFKGHAAEVFRLNREGVKYLEEYFDYKYPFPKYDIVLIPEFPFGGMEHAGATFLRESSIIFPSEPTANDYISRANVIFHEAAHQWFGDTVTMRWFDDLWLKEGFAEFMAYKTLERVMPQYNAWKAFYERNKPAAYATDSTRGTTPIYQEIPNLSAAKSAYGNIVYRKAPSFLRQAEFYLGPDKFQTAVRAFLKKHGFANAGWQDLVGEFETASGQRLEAWAKQWVQQPGLPLIRISISDGGEVTARQILPSSASHGWPLTFQIITGYGVRNRDIDRVFFRDALLDAGGDLRLVAGFAKPDDPRRIVWSFPNYGDYGYGIFLLDDKSRDYVLKNIQNEKDDFLRSMMWGTLWDSVREGELDPQEYVELTIKNIGVEKDELTIQTILGRVSTAMTFYIPSEDSVSSPHVSKGSTSGNDNVEPSLTVGLRTRTAGLRSRLEDLLIAKMRTAPTLGQRVTFYRAFLTIASTENARKVLKEMLRNGGGNLSGSEGVPAGQITPQQANAQRGTLPTGRVSASDVAIPLKTKDRFDIVTKLAILGDPDAPALLAGLEKSETSDDAKRYAYAARAAFPTKENREKFWDDFVNNKDISESWIEAAMGPFNSPRHSELSLPYLQRALAELPNLKRNRKIFFVNGWLGAFIGGQKSQEALDIVNKFLADNPGLDRDLRLKVLENVDVVERAVKIRARFGK